MGPDAPVGFGELLCVSTGSTEPPFMLSLGPNGNSERVRVTIGNGEPPALDALI